MAGRSGAKYLSFDPYRDRTAIGRNAADCAGNVLSTITLPDAGVAVDGNPVSGWIEVSVPGTPLPSGAASARVSLDTIAGASGYSYYLLDNVQVVPPDEIFPDTFEAN